MSMCTHLKIHKWMAMETSKGVTMFGVDIAPITCATLFECAKSPTNQDEDIMDSNILQVQSQTMKL